VKREAHASEILDLKQQLEQKSAEIRGLNSSLESLKNVNEELKVRYNLWVPDLPLTYLV
jgi:kinesin family member 5